MPPLVKPAQTRSWLSVRIAKHWRAGSSGCRCDVSVPSCHDSTPRNAVHNHMRSDVIAQRVDAAGFNVGNRFPDQAAVDEPADLIVGRHPQRSRSIHVERARL